MQTRYIKVSPFEPEPDAIDQAAAILKADGLVAFPTETVYGLGACASSTAAVEKIFAAKKRPAGNPLLVHVCSLEQAEALVAELPPLAERLMQRFWPGPLSLVLPARSGIPAIVTGGKDTIGLRMPSHPVALALINRSGPLAAPSANLSGRPSPVNPEHVRTDLEGRIDCILDAGPTGNGIESTVLDLSGGQYRVLRPGGVAVEDIAALIGKNIIIDNADQNKRPHYKIKTRIVVARDNDDFIRLVSGAQRGNTGIVYNTLTAAAVMPGIDCRYQLDLSGQKGSLYTILRQAEAQQLDLLIFAPLPRNCSGVARAIIDRIQKAASSGDNFSDH